MRVLIIEDDDDLRSDMVEMLEYENYEPLTAVNGKDGLDKALQSHPDLIFCDMKMPILDGYETLVELRNNPITANIPIVMLTGNTDTGMVKKLKDAGANDCITKPFSFDDLFAIIDSYRPKLMD